MKRNRQELGKNKLENCLLQIPTSKYSKLYCQYLKQEFSAVEAMLKNLVKMPFCKAYYLKYPLEGLLRGICKKLLINCYQFVFYGYFLSQVEWKLDHYIYSSLAEVFPNVIHVNEPTNPEKLKQLSMFLYLSSYSVKQFLSEDISLIKAEMVKLFPEFEHLQAHWTSTQTTVGQVLNPRSLNSFYRLISKSSISVDYNTCIDKILQISPCYDIAGRNEKVKELPSFGFMGNEGQSYGFQLEGNENINIKIEDNLEEFQFDGQI